MEKLAREAETAAKEDRRQGDAIMLVSLPYTLVADIYVRLSALLLTERPDSLRSSQSSS